MGGGREKNLLITAISHLPKFTLQDVKSSSPGGARGRYLQATSGKADLKTLVADFSHQPHPPPPAAISLRGLFRVTVSVGSMRFPGVPWLCGRRPGCNRNPQSTTMAPWPSEQVDAHLPLLSARDAGEARQTASRKDGASSLGRQAD